MKNQSYFIFNGGILFLHLSNCVSENKMQNVIISDNCWGFCLKLNCVSGFIRRSCCPPAAVAILPKIIGQDSCEFVEH